MKILNFGSLNIDHVYQVDHIARPGETISSTSYRVFAGGKGANQSAALALAGAQVFHAGQVGPEGAWLVEKLAGLGVDMRYTLASHEPTGHAIIQVDSSGQNSIVLYPGANSRISRQAIDAVLRHFEKGDILLLQNEINEIPYIIEQADENAMDICLNPAPFGPEVLGYPLDRVELLVVNETEAMGLLQTDSIDHLLPCLAAKWPQCRMVLTLGERGALYRAPDEDLEIPAPCVQAVDTTAAGDTFIGYFLAGLAGGHPPRQALERAARAAALCVTRPGAMDSIPSQEEVDRFM
jgi:ribokinase